MFCPPRKIRKHGDISDDESSGMQEGESEFLCPVCGNHIGYLSAGTDDDEEFEPVDTLWQSAVEAWQDKVEMDLDPQ